MKITFSHRPGKRRAALAALIVTMLAACSSFAPLPTATATLVPPTGTPTQVIHWFPPTKTPEKGITVAVMPTPDQHPGIGSLIYSDLFDKPELWSTASSTYANAIVTRNQLVLSLNGHGPASISSLRSAPTLTDFYADATADVSLCGSTDQYGMLFRAAPGNNYYRFSLNCNGQARLERSANGQIYVLQDWVPSGDVTFGAPAHIHLGVWAVGRELRLFLNDAYQFSVSDALFSSGTIGFFAYASGKSAITVSFSDLLVYSVNYSAPTPTFSPSPTKKP